MKSIITLIIAMSLSIIIYSQELGNAYYLNRVDFSNSQINSYSPPPADGSILLRVNGLANIKADSYVAIFSVSQMGKTVEEVNRLIDERIKGSLDKIEVHEDVETFIDMISFVPKYEYQVEKKRFSKNTYNEVPAGFELKKNIHIKYKDPNFLNTIIASLSSYEIYDMVRVDYFSDQIEEMKKKLKEKARILLAEKLKSYEEIQGVTLDENEKKMSESTTVKLPAELYRSYQSYSSSSLMVKKPGTATQVSKSKTHYYQPIVEKDYDFTINSTILQPVIQVTYSLNLTVKKLEEKIVEVKQPEKKIEKMVEKKVILITHDGLVKPININ